MVGLWKSKRDRRALSVAAEEFGLIAKECKHGGMPDVLWRDLGEALSFEAEVYIGQGNASAARTSQVRLAPPRVCSPGCLRARTVQRALLSSRDFCLSPALLYGIETWYCLAPHDTRSASRISHPTHHRTCHIIALVTSRTHHISHLASAPASRRTSNSIVSSRVTRSTQASALAAFKKYLSLSPEGSDAPIVRSYIGAAEGMP